MVGSAEGRGVAEGVKGPNWDGGSGPLMTGEAGPPGSEGCSTAGPSGGVGAPLRSSVQPAVQGSLGALKGVLNHLAATNERGGGERTCVAVLDDEVSRKDSEEREKHAYHGL